jgi:hypothetical protein
MVFEARISHIGLIFRQLLYARSFVGVAAYDSGHGSQTTLLYHPGTDNC